MISPVLVLGAEPRISITISRCLQRRGIPVDVGVLSDNEPVLSSRFVRNFLRFPSMSDPAQFLERMRQAIQSNGYDMLIPTSDTTLTACLAHYAALSQLLHVACPPPEVTHSILDKSCTLVAAEQCGIRIPATYPIRTAADVEAVQPVLKFPLIAKPKEKVRTAAFKTRRFETHGQLVQAFTENPEFGSQNLIQECCTGVGIGVELLLHRGQAVAQFQHRRLKEFPASGGVSVLAVSEELDRRLFDESLRLLRSLHWEGVAMVEFLVDPRSGASWLMEVNGRYWGSLATAVHAGVDFPYYHWRIVHGQTPEASSPYKCGLRARWLCGDFLRLHSLFFPPSPAPHSPWNPWRELLRFLYDFRSETRDMLWSWKDPKPALAEFARELSHVLNAHARNVAGRLAPNFLKQWVLTGRRLGPSAGLIYRKRRLGTALGLIRDPSPRLPSSVKTILFVCHGNIIRSPAAAAILKKSIGEPCSLSIVSAGLFAKDSKPADPRAQIAAERLGISLDNHRAQRLTEDLVEQANVIFVMDFENEAVLLDRFPKASKKTFLLGALPTEAPSPSVEIPDPYDGDLVEVQRCFDRINDHIRGLVSKLSCKS